MLLRLYPLSLAALLALAFGEKLLFALYHRELHQSLSPTELAGALVWGLRFDLAIAAGFALLAFTAAYLLFRLLRLPFTRGLEYSTLAAGAVLLLIHGADLLYYEEAGRHLGYELKEGYNSGAALAAAAFGTYLGPITLQGLLLLLFFTATRLLFRWRPFRATPAGGRLFAPEATWAGALLISVILVRGGLQSVPLEPLHAQEIGDPQRAALALNGAYNAVFSSITPYAVEPVLAEKPTAEDEALVRALYAGDKPHAFARPKPLNVVFVLLESWSAEYMSAYGFDQPTTPVFAELREKGLTTRAMFADGVRTTEGMFATFCSAQNPLGATVAQTQLQNFDYDCLPELLTQRGYSSAFFQGTLENTSGTGAFARLLGFAESYGKGDMPPPRLEPNSWGYHDPDIYRFAHQKMREMPQPFLVGINTNTTHDKRLTPGLPPVFGRETRAERYLSTLHFADQALGEFVERVTADPAIADTVFVLLADHAGLKSGDVVRSHTIPFVLYAPGIIGSKRADRIASQRDVAPTLLEVLGIEMPGWFTGKSLLRDDEGPYFADLFHAGRLGWAEGERLVVFPVKNPDQTQCYTYAPDAATDTPIACGMEGERQLRHALAFTRVFQDLLFSGKVRQFAALRAKH